MGSVFLNFSLSWLKKDLKQLRKHWRLRRAYKTKPDDFFTQLPNSVYYDAKCVFVLSTGRAGTALLTKLFELGKNTDVYHTPFPQLKYLSKFAYENAESDKHCVEMAINVARFELILESFITNRVLIETNNRITFFAPSLASVFKKSRFIHVTRHPASFVRSAVRRGYYIDPRSAPGLITPKCEPMISKWCSMSPIEKNAHR